MKRIIIELSEKEYKRAISVSNRRKRSISNLCKHILMQLADNDEIEDVTGKKKNDSSVYKKQTYFDQRRLKYGQKN